MEFKKMVTITQNGKRNTDVQNRLLDSVGEGEGVRFERTASKHVYYLG